MMKPSGCRQERGFTLTELLAVVTIIGILAGIAIYSVRRYVVYTKSVEGREILGSIMAGEESYMDETFRYLSITPDEDTHYPLASLDGSVKVQWGADLGGCSNCAANFKTIGVNPSQPVLFRYACVAEGGAADPSTLRPSQASGDPFSDVGAPGRWQYVANAVSDLDGDDSTHTVFIASSHQSDIWGESVGQ